MPDTREGLVPDPPEDAAVIADRCPACRSLEVDDFSLDGTELICLDCGTIWEIPE